MFTKTNATHQKLFSNVPALLSNSSLKEYENTTGWHNIFREQVTCRIDEEIFRPLFCADNGAPNASIRVLIGMMILKEARGLSDSQLFEECRFNLLVRSALCLPNIDDSLPASSTYYLLRRRIVEWERSGHENLIEKTFSQITKSQAFDFQINGKNIRMDSKLLGSNIAWYSRYELIHETLRKAYPCIKSELKNLFLSESSVNLLKNISIESGDKVSYRSSKAEIETKLCELGKVIYQIVQQMGDHSSESVQILCRVFHEQYVENEDGITPRAKEAISAGSVQSPHDSDCHYRNKDGNQKKGYSINLAETCDSNDPFNLITNVQVEVASRADCDFLQLAIEASSEVIVGKIETANADGAYHSVDNQHYCKESGIDLILGAVQGKPSRYDLSYDDKDELIVTDLITNTIIPCRPINSRKDDTLKWRIKDEKGNNRYFTQKEVDTCLLRKQITARTREELNVRNNVEATIFQLGYHYSNDKSRYRGLIKHKMWANLRCIWVNFVRILKFIALNGENCLKNLKKQGFLSKLLANCVEMFFLLFVVKDFCLELPKRKYNQIFIK
jgi:hypothetical protein